MKPLITEDDYRLRVRYSEGNMITLDGCTGEKASVLRYLRNLSLENVERIVFEKVKLKET